MVPIFQPQIPQSAPPATHPQEALLRRQLQHLQDLILRLDLLPNSVLYVTPPLDQFQQKRIIILHLFDLHNTSSMGMRPRNQENLPFLRRLG